MLDDPEFRKIFEEMSVTKNGDKRLFEEKVETNEQTPALPKNPDEGDAQKSVPTFDAILSQQLAQMDGKKYLLMQNLVSAKTYGFRKFDVVLSEETDFSQGSFVSTSQPLDLAIHGDGFFVVKFQGNQFPPPTALPSPPYPPLLTSSPSLLMPHASSLKPSPPSLLLKNALAVNSVFYTRCGHFYLTRHRKIALQHDGFSFLLQPEITVPFHAVSCEYRSNGDFLVKMPDGSPLKIGELKLAFFDSPKVLGRLDGVLFCLMPGSAGPEMKKTNEAVQSGQLEMSNVDVTETFETYHRLHRLQTLLLEKLK